MFSTTAYPPTAPLADWGSLPHLTGSLVGVGIELHARGEDDAMIMFDAAYNLLRAPSNEACALASKHIEVGSRRLLCEPSSSNGSTLTPPDLYEADECDVGPRLLKTPIRLDSTSPLDIDFVFLEVVVLMNKALIIHAKSNLPEAKQLYQVVVNNAQNLLRLRMGLPSTRLVEICMRVHNNMGQICYVQGEEGTARSHFEASMLFAKQLSDLNKDYRLEYATVLSNWCRVNWMRGDISDNLYKGLCEVLRIRSALLKWDHPDVAAAHFNVAVAEYARQRSQQATTHFKRYLHVATCRSNDAGNDLDPIPALIYALLIEHEEKDDSMSQELVRGLRTLQDKRQDQGPHTSEVASVLNFIGTLLFHKQDFDRALLFFQEELRLEETLAECKDDISVAVTCNNIARILQELGKFHDAMLYYQRALKTEYGDIKQGVSKGKIFSLPKATGSDASPSAANLYSTVWYNLGLIHDKLGSYGDAIAAFKMSLELRKTMLGQDHPDIACLLYNIGVLQMEQQLLTDASTSFREALRIRRVGTAGQLNDRHVVKTLEKLASLHKAKGNVSGALDAFREVLRIQEVSDDYDTAARLRDMGVTLRSVSELHHATGDLQSAAGFAQESVRKLQSVASESTQPNVDIIEQVVSSFLLVGSIYHEMCEPLLACRIFEQASQIMQQASIGFSSPSLFALSEVTLMLATTHCAPEA